MRLFVALDIPDEIRSKLTTFMDGVRNFAPDARWVTPESLHVTLKFIGEFSETQSQQLKETLSTIVFEPFDIRFRKAGFFTQRSPRVFWVGIEAGPELKGLAASIDAALVPLGVSAETHDFRPHLTLARTGSGRPQGSPRDRNKPSMWVLRDRVQTMPPPDFGTMSAREFFLYLSKLSPKGAQYSKLERFPLE